MTRVRGAWIDRPGTVALMALLADAGHQVLFVGGCVRNALLGLPVADVDIATDAQPERVIELAKGAGLKALPTGIDHGTVTVVADGVAHEVTTFRKDVETDGRRAVVAFSTDVTEDARRRDLTINALYARADGTLVDPLGGLGDLKARRIRFIGRPEDRIREDHLRSLRFFRFFAIYGDAEQGLDADGLAAVAANLDGLDQLSRERVGAEMMKLLSAPDPAPAVAAMHQTGVLARILPGADIRALAPLVHLEGDLLPDPIRRLAALGGDMPEERFRLSRENAQRLAVLRDETGTNKGIPELGYRHGERIAVDIALLRAALLETAMTGTEAEEARRGAAATFPVSAKDLMPHLTGPALGEQLRRLEARWIESGFALTREELLA